MIIDIDVMMNINENEKSTARYPWVNRSYARRQATTFTHGVYGAVLFCCIVYGSSLCLSTA